MSKTLLLADDSVVIQKLVALSFANEDVELVTVYNGDEAVEKAQECLPDVVLADVVMPGKNGYEVCEAIRQNPQLAHVPVLLLTGTFEAFDEDRAAQAGSNGHITKPFEAQALVERVAELLAAAPPPPATESVPSPAQAEEQSAYDFFEEDAPATAETAEAPPAPIEDAGVFAFGDDAPSVSGPGASASDLELGSDQTIAIMGAAPSLGGEGSSADPLVGMSDQGPDPDAMTITASGFETPRATSGGESQDFASHTTAPRVPQTEAPATVVAGLDPTGAPVAGDDELFAEPIASPEAAPDLEFRFGDTPETAMPPELDLSAPDAAAPPLAEAELDPAGSSAYDVSISDLGDSFAMDIPAPQSAPAAEPVSNTDPLAITPVGDPFEMSAAAAEGALPGSAPAAADDPFEVASPALGSDPLAEPAPAIEADPFEIAAPDVGNDPLAESAAAIQDDPFEIGGGHPPAASAAPIETGPPAASAAPIGTDPLAASAASVETHPFAEPAGSVDSDPLGESGPPLEADPFDQIPPTLESDPLGESAPALETGGFDSNSAVIETGGFDANPAEIETGGFDANPAEIETGGFDANPAEIETGGFDANPAEIESEPWADSSFDAGAPDESSPFESALLAEAEQMEAPEPFAPVDDQPTAPQPARPAVESAPVVVASESAQATAAGAHLSDVMRDRVHETLEKVAWEAFADLSDTIVRQVLDRVERVAWEVIPQMAETLIQEEIRRIKDGEGDES